MIELAELLGGRREGVGVDRLKAARVWYGMGWYSMVWVRVESYAGEGEVR